MSLDAPLIAILWQALFLKCFRESSDPLRLVSLGIGVWLLYVADRVLDGRKNPAPSAEAPRHRFYRAHRRALLPWIAAFSAITAWLSLDSLPVPLLADYLALGCVVSIYFAVVHFAPPAVQAYWPKELAVGLLFAAGVCLPVSAEFHQRSILAPFLVFSALLWVNALAIECWEAEMRAGAPTPQKLRITRLVGNHLRDASLGIALAAAVLAFDGSIRAGEHSLYAAIFLTSASMAALDSVHARLSADLLRALADVSLLTPLLFLPSLLK